MNLSVNERDSSSLIVYSLVSHEIVKQVRLPGPATQFESSRDWIVVGLAAPKAELRVLSLSTLEVLGIIPGAGLHLSLSTYASASHTSISQSDVSNSTAANSPEPVFALSGRLLAYATTPPDAATASTSFASISAVTAPADISFASGLGSAASGLSQLVGRAARGETTREELTRTRDDLARAGASVAGAGVSVAGSVLSGLRGMLGEEGGRGGVGRLFSRGSTSTTSAGSAKTTKESGQQRVSGSPPSVPTTMPRAKTEGYGVVVVDLTSLVVRILLVVCI